MKDLDGLREINVLLKRLQTFNPNDRFLFFFFSFFIKILGKLKLQIAQKDKKESLWIIVSLKAIKRAKIVGNDQRN